MSGEQSHTGVADAKRAAAVRALDFVRDGMKLGLGTGSTAKIFVDLLAERVASGLDVVCVPTSERTADQARSAGIRLAAFDDEPVLDLTIDGADQCDPQLRLIKGGGGALLREKIVAAASKHMVVIADSSKAKPVLGTFPLPVEVNKFGLMSTRLAVESVVAAASQDGHVELRKGADGATFVTDGGHFILDCHLHRIEAPEELGCALHHIPGVVEHGLFIGLATTIILAGADGKVTLLGHPGA